MKPTQHFTSLILLFAISLLSFSQENLSSINYQELISENQILNDEISTNLFVGKTAGNHGVSATGAFSYNVPISIPEGIMGMQPNLSINYSSQGRNGILGYGWGLGGLSSIYRSSKTLFTDQIVDGFKLNNDDAFSWDGNRLIATSGFNGENNTEYGTEAESFARIISHGQLGPGSGPEWFEVELKSGLIMEYGRTIDSRQIGVDGFAAIVWKLNKTMDRNGNYVMYNYTIINNEHLLSSISYTGTQGTSPFININFAYQERTDQNSIYTGNFGTEIMSKHLLTQIDVVLAATSERIKKYEFKYGFDRYSFLNEIFEYGKNNESFNPLRFSYFEGDFNGDGLTDILRVFYKLNHNNIKTFDSY